MQTRRIARFAAVVLFSLGFAACSASVSIGGKTIDRSKLEDEVATQLQQQVGADAPPNIDCPDSLKAKEDAVTHCELTTDDSDEAYDVRVTVTSVKDDDVKFDIKVADEPK